MKKIDFVEKSNAHVTFENRLTNAALGGIVGGDRVEELQQQESWGQVFDSFECTK